VIMADTDAEILSGASVTVEVCGGTYLYQEPSRRKAREMLSGIVAIGGHAQGGKPAQIESVNLMLDWLYKWCPAMAAQSADIDARATEAEISNAFSAVASMVTRPFVLTAAGPQESPTSTQSPAPTS